MLIDCDKNMIVHLLRNWRPNRLRPQGFRLSRDRPGLIAKQNDVCPLCSMPLTNNGKDTHIDHHKTVKAFADEVLNGLPFDEAYRQLWDESNIRAICSKCNYGRKEGA